MSERSDIAQEIADKINELKLNNPYGGEVGLQSSKKGGKYYAVAFSYPRYIDGVVMVFSPKNIVVETTRSVKHCKSKEEAIAELEEINGV